MSFLLSCKKEEDLYLNHVDVSSCKQMLYVRSKQYSNPYMGTLSTNSVTPPQTIYPEKYCYWFPCTNPSNEYEFCYCRMSNTSPSLIDMDLFTFNFCSGKTNLVSSKLRGRPDWSSQNWIIFSGNDANLWKIKPNGDSLIQLSNSGNDFFAKWSPNGERYVFNGSGIAIKNGNVVSELPTHCSSCLWKNDSILIGGIESSNAKEYQIYEQNVNTLSSRLITKIPMYGTGNMLDLKVNTAYFYVSNPDNSGTNKYFSLDLSSLDTVVLQTLPQSFSQFWALNGRNKIILQQVLRDTMTGNPSKLNYRSHIAIMDLDYRNERQVLIPE